LILIALKAALVVFVLPSPDNILQSLWHALECWIFQRWRDDLKHNKQLIEEMLKSSEYVYFVTREVGDVYLVSQMTWVVWSIAVYMFLKLNE
jgi:hypothetical protein